MQEIKMKTIFITGGHFTPALAIIENLPKDLWRIFYVGRKHSLEGDAALSQEYIRIRASGFTFVSLTTGRLQRTLTRFSLTSLLKIPLGFIQAAYYILTCKPDVVLSFGGYVAVPVVVVSWFLRIPIVTHEQTLAPGLANKIISFFSKKICIAWKQEQSFFPAKKTIYTGNPLRNEIFQTIRSLPLPVTTRPLIYITGGNQESHSLNEIVEKALDRLLAKYTVVHQCGNAFEFKDYERLLKLRETLPEKVKNHYHLYQFITEEYIGWLLKKTDLVVGRAGANMVSELIALAKVAILIPLPWAGENEQIKNARLLEKQGAAKVIEQKDLTPEVLTETIVDVLKQHAAYSKNLNTLKYLVPLNAAENIIRVVESVV